MLLAMILGGAIAFYLLLFLHLLDIVRSHYRDIKIEISMRKSRIDPWEPGVLRNLERELL